MTACPSCAAPVSGVPGTEVVCPACFGAFTIPTPAPTAFDVLLADGTRHTGINRWRLRERVYTNAYPPTARLSPAGTNEWGPIHEVEELRAIYTLTGTELPMATGTRHIAGWRSANEAKPEPRRRSAAAEAEHSVPRVNEPTPRAAPPPPKPFVAPKRAPAPVVSEGATVQLVAGGLPEEELELEEEISIDPRAEDAAVVPREITLPAPKRSLLPWVLVGVAAAGLGLAMALILGSLALG